MFVVFVGLYHLIKRYPFILLMAYLLQVSDQTDFKEYEENDVEIGFTLCTKQLQFQSYIPKSPFKKILKETKTFVFLDEHKIKAESFVVSMFYKLYVLYNQMLIGRRMFTLVD